MSQNILHFLNGTCSACSLIKKFLVFLVLVALTTGSAIAQIATYTGLGGTSTATSGVANETVTTLQTVGFGANTACGSGGISGLTNNGVFAYAPSNAHLFMQIRPNAGYALNITGFTAGLRRSGSGLQKVRFAYSLDNGATWIDDLTDHVPNNGGCGSTAVSAWGVGALPTGITNTTNGIIVALYPYAPIAAGGVIQVNTIVIYGSVVPANVAPAFVGGGTQSLVVCENSAATVIDPLMAITDPDVGQTETWTIVTPPSFGLLGGFSTSATSTGLTITPGGLTYTPNPGFSGIDGFKVQISDGLASAVTQVNVTVNPSPAPISGSLEVCEGSSTPLSDATGGGSWLSVNPGIATVGSASGILSGISSGTATISYSAATGCSISAIATVNPLPAPITGSPVVCVGSNTSLTDAAPGGVWSTNNALIATAGSSSGIVTGVASGTTMLTYTLPTGCFTTIPVTVNALPAPITGPATVCTGSLITLASATPGGTWASGGPAATIVSTTGVLSGVTTGTTTITYTSPLGCTITNVITVNQTPGAITGATNVCSGATTVLSNTLTGGSWSSGNTAIATVGSSTGVVTGIITGTTTITYTSAAGCSVSASFTVNTSPAPIAGITNVCTGLTILLSNGVPGGVWSSSAPGIAGIGSLTGIVNGVSVGTTTVSYVLTGSCTATTVVTVNPTLSAISGTAVVCVGSTSTLSNTVGGGMWSSTNTLVGSVGSSSGIVTGVSAGTVVISYSSTTCAAVSVVVTVNPLPAPITGPGNVCEGFSINLTDATAGGTWSSSLPYIATVSGTGVVAGVTAGIISISYILPTSCLIAKTVTVNQVPTPITGGSVICVGTTTALSEGIAGGTWLSTLPVVASVDVAGNVTGISGGTTLISYTLPGGCRETFAMTVNAAPTAISGSSNMCTGQTIAFSDAISGGMWSSSATSVASVNPVSGIVNAINPGGVFVSYSIAGCPSVTKFVNVSLSPSPLSGIIHVCAGLTTSLSDAIPGGSWSSSNPSVTVSATGLISGLSTGAAATITYSLPSGCFVTADVYAELPPAVISGPDTVCPGSFVDLSDSTPGGVWGSSDGTIAEAIASTGQINGLVTGSVTLSYTLISGCYRTMSFRVLATHPASLTVTTSPLDSALCYNVPVTLTADDSNAGAPTFIWKLFGTIYMGTGPVLTYNPQHGDFITCTMTAHNVCATPSVIAKDVVLNVWPQVGPIVEISCDKADTTSYLGEVYTFFSVVTYGGPSPVYQWYINNVAVAGATAPVFTTRIYNDNDTIYCKVTGNSPCDTGSYIGISNRKVVYGQGFLSVGAVDASQQLTLFPNPNNGSFLLAGTVNNVNDNSATVEIFDVLGRSVFRQSTQIHNGKLEMPVRLRADISNGLYVLKLQVSASTYVLRFIVTN